MPTARAGTRLKAKREKAKPRGGGGGSSRHALSEMLGRVPIGAFLFTLGIGLGFGIGLFIADLPPAPVTAVKPIASAPAPSAKVSAAPDPVEPAPGTPVVEPAQPATMNPATAEEGVHQSATVTALPPDQPAPDQASVDDATDDGVQPLWLRNAVASVDPGDRPMITIVIDDVGISPQHAEMAIALPAPVVISIMTYAGNAAALAREARSRGHELLVHMPMQPVDDRVHAGPNSLTVGLSEAEIRRRVVWGLNRLAGYVGFNNHMGSRFTQDEAGMRVVLAEAKNRGLLFLDSKTIAGSIADRLAGQMGVVHIERDVFIDDDMSEAAVARQLAATEAIARQQGFAVAIGHPHPATIAVLRRWLPEARKRGFAIVPLTTIVKKREGLAG
jgi:hypothetical protein